MNHFIKNIRRTINNMKEKIFFNILEAIEEHIGEKKFKETNILLLTVWIFFIITCGDSRIKLANIPNLEKSDVDTLTIFDHWIRIGSIIVDYDCAQCMYTDSKTKDKIFKYNNKLFKELPKCQINKKIKNRIDLALERLLLINPKIFDMTAFDSGYVMQEWVNWRTYGTVYLKDLILSAKYYTQID